MAIREYRCSCKLTIEKILPIEQEPLPEILCPKCGAMAQFVPFSRTSFVQSTFSNIPVDLAVGADANAKWQMYHDRQEERNRVRKETGSLGLTEVDGKYQPIPDSRKQLREDGVQARRVGCPEDSEMTF